MNRKAVGENMLRIRQRLDLAGQFQVYRAIGLNISYASCMVPLYLSQLAMKCLKYMLPKELAEKHIP